MRETCEEKRLRRTDTDSLSSMTKLTAFISRLFFETPGVVECVDGPHAD